ncbi:hypothetical protein SAMN05421784_11245 [Xenorhabdus koppenhoeferi]|uniref:Uncharacterized protein n=1 Tax=Xenorhabdus koppenhoeferi TaxID=351659 RepID=A0A1I7HAA5_9GAMM|nr:hypothetical protein SAMN05421784_11245 [Xenorhabdus koppenhoeferi]
MLFDSLPEEDHLTGRTFNYAYSTPKSISPKTCFGISSKVAFNLLTHKYI